MRETKADMLQGLFGVASAKIIRPNTLRIKFDDGTEAVRLHRTNILMFHPDGSTVYNSGGWKTYTTKERMNDHGPAVIRQEKGVWYISTDGWETQSVYYDGVTVKDGQVLNPQADPSAEYNRVKKLIEDYIKAAKTQIKVNGIPEPSAGDCWICKWLHDPNEPPDCLLSHLEEKYLHGTLIYNALKERGYRGPFFIMNFPGGGDMVLRALRVYFKKNVLDKMKG